MYGKCNEQEPVNMPLLATKELISESTDCLFASIVHTLSYQKLYEDANFLRIMLRADPALNHSIWARRKVGHVNTKHRGLLQKTLVND